MTTTIYVQLLAEGTDVWRPAQAAQMGDLFKLLGPTPDGERWQFAPGTIVRVESRRLYGGVVPVAVEAVTDL